MRTSMLATKRKYDPAEAPARKAVYGRSNGDCEIRIPVVCTGRGEEWHHRKNRSQGGPWSASNGLHACRGCHATVTHPRAEYLSAGWCVQQWQVPAEVPVKLHHGWVLLNDQGDYTPYLQLKEAS
jgi:hypothetical protein